MVESPPIDVEYPEVTARTIAFGSCHKNKAVKPHQPNIWNSISTLKPDAFLWTGDLVYSPKKGGVAPVDVLKAEYDQLKYNKTVGYSEFLSNADAGGYLKGGVHATLDDHDYGANDCGRNLPNLKERQDLFLDFLGDESEQRRNRNGVYSTVTFGKVPQKTKVIFLDTRSGRSKHCIPSVAGLSLPLGLGSAFACVTRGITAALNLQKYVPICSKGTVLHEEQWDWLEKHLLATDSQLNIVVSSIQVLTTNKFMESWGHFPEERERLIKLLNQVEEKKSVILLSGDVHHSEILDASRGVRKSEGRIIEVTSSGLTHR
jgi:alkaline phosphatase D